jgi:hypothetical protein
MNKSLAQINKTRIVGAGMMKGSALRDIGLL